MEPAGGDYNALPATLAGFRGPTSKGEGKRRNGKKRREEKGKGRKERGLLLRKGTRSGEGGEE